MGSTSQPDPSVTADAAVMVIAESPRASELPAEQLEIITEVRDY